MSERKPLKRHKALVEFSRDHHFGLLLCWKLRKGIAAGVSAERMSAYLQYFFRQHLVPHFELEEQLVFPLLSREDNLRLEVEQQHRDLYRLIKQLQENHENQLAVLKEFEKQLEKHIRFEERKLFMHIQEVLTESKLQELQEEVEAGHTHQQEKWDDKFWE